MTSHMEIRCYNEERVQLIHKDIQILPKYFGQ